MARWRVRELAERKGFKSAYQLALESKLPINTVKPIWEGTAKGIMLKTIDKLAVALKVPPGELIGNGEAELGDSLPVLLAA